MSISQYQAFLKTIELGNLTRAAEDLGYTQSGITHLLNALEDDCGIKLLVREKTGAYATADGQELLPYFEDICQAYEDMNNKLNEIHRLEAGLIRIATFTSVSVQWLPGILAEFKAQHPLVNFQLLHSTGDENIEWLRTGKVDCAFVTSLENSNYPTYTLHNDPLVAVLPADHPLAEKETVDVEELAEYDYIKLNDGTFSEAKEISAVFKKHGVKPNVVFSEENDYAIAAMVEKGLGVSILPHMIVRKTGRNIAVRPLTSGEERTLGLAVKNVNRMTQSTKEFIRYAQEWVERNYA